MQECVLELCRSAGVPARREVLIDNSGQRPADVYFPSFRRGQPLAVDVTVSHPSQATHTNSDGETVFQSASERAALAKADAKNTKYLRQCQDRGVLFQPVAICTFGGWLPEGIQLIQELAKRGAVRTRQDFSIIVTQYWQRLGIALWCGNTTQILHCLA